MRHAIILSALAALAAAVPKPQDIDYAAVEDAPKPAITGPAPSAVAEDVPVDISAAAASASASVQADPLTKRGVNDPCAPQPDGKGPKPPSDSEDAFINYTVFSQTAQSAGASPPGGYATAFNDLKGAVNGYVYLGLTTFDSYDTVRCAHLCDAKDGCAGFNIYFERDPTVNPAPGCPNPKPFTNVKCTLWGTPVTTAMAVNVGQTREQFKVVIAGSNGYNKNTPPDGCPLYNGPTPLGGAINAPLYNGVDTYLGVKFFVQPYDPSICAAACTSQTAYDRRHPTNGTYKPCNFFVSYVLSKNGIPQGLYCSLYTRPWDRSYATNQGQYRGSDYYSVSQAYSYTLATQDPGTI